MRSDGHGRRWLRSSCGTGCRGPGRGDNFCGGLRYLTRKGRGGDGVATARRSARGVFKGGRRRGGGAGPREELSAWLDSVIFVSVPWHVRTHFCRSVAGFVKMRVQLSTVDAIADSHLA